ncbi:MAG: PAS domain-containing protein [Arcicella sp.]|jgi:PAS domain S-box-containing protein|nr:PAS domain-containing protein [Arcicella sp.]
MDLSKYLLEVFCSEKQNDLFDSFLRAIPDFVYLLDLTDGKITYLNEKLGVLAYYSEEEVMSLDKSFFPVKNYENREDFIKHLNTLFEGAEEGDNRSFKLELQTKEGKHHFVRNRGTLLRKNKEGTPTKVVVIAEDITAETESFNREKQKQQQLNDAENLFRYGSWDWQLGTDYVTWSNGLYDIFGYDAAEYPDSKMDYGTYTKHIVEEDRERIVTLSLDIIDKKKKFYEFEHDIIDKQGKRKHIAVKGRCFMDETGKVVRVMGTSEDVTELSELKDTLTYKVEELSTAYDELKKAKSLFKEAEALMNYGSFDWDVEKDEIKWSDGLKRLFAGRDITQLPEKLNYRFYDSRVHEDDRERVSQIVQNSIQNKDSYSFEHRLVDLEEQEKTVQTKGWVVTDDEGKVVRFIGNTVDISEMKVYERELEMKVEELNRSNRELEQFAYVASHDLQEPLRKIMAFGERLSLKFSEQLSSDGQFYINRMLDATNRMKILIENLLSYSRASRKLESMVSVDLNDVITNVLSDLEMKVQETQADISVGNLPVIMALPSQMQQLFQNLISNAIKFVSPDKKPIVSIKATEVTKQEIQELNLAKKFKNYIKISIQDNGIGFEAEYSEKIFIIFQRLHGRADFEGTGLGLAICKKIVENHQGYIVADSELGKGATFTVYLPLI